MYMSGYVTKLGYSSGIVEFIRPKKNYEIVSIIVIYFKYSWNSVITASGYGNIY